MSDISKVVIVGGGTAGWLTAGMLAARYPRQGDAGLSITLVESPDLPTIGVGEGTWPTIRATLQRIGIDEADFMKRADASFKQGSRFDGWVDGSANDRYHHPFTNPPPADAADLYAAWQAMAANRDFADIASAQQAVCDAGLAPRQAGMPDYQGMLNYAYHFDAGKFAGVVREHCVETLGVNHVEANVTGFEATDNGDLAALETKEKGRIEGDLFVDCTGLRSMILGDHFGIAFKPCGDRLFNDTALAVQVPVEPDSPIASQTIGTAHSAGWTWEIGLPNRRGIGFVYSSSHLDDEAAHEGLAAYLRRTNSTKALDDLNPRTIRFTSGWREKFWHRNCVAIGLSAGFVEPLEASAIVSIELGAAIIADNFPRTREAVDILAKRYNSIFSFRWARVEDFLKLHYVLSKRDEPYWKANRDPASMSERLSEALRLWKVAPPSNVDFDRAEMFTQHSYQYVLYGMGFRTTLSPGFRPLDPHALTRQLRHVQDTRAQLLQALPTNRALLGKATPPA